MAFRFDERALQILRGEEVNNLAAWGSYPLFLASFYKILEVLWLLSYRISIVFWLNQFLGLATATLAFKTLRYFKTPYRPSFIFAGLFLLINPLQLYINGMNISESLFQFTTCLALALYLDVFSLTAWKKWLGFFVCLVFAVMARNIILPFVILLPIYLFWVEPQGRKILFSKEFLGAALLAGVLLLTLGQINAHLDKYKNTSLNLNRGANLAQTWCEAPTLHFKTEENSFWFSPPAFWPLEKTRSIYLEKDFADTKFYTNMAWQCLRKDPSLLIFRIRSLLNVFDGPFYPDPLKGQMRGVAHTFSMMYAVLFFFVIFGIKYLWKERSGKILLFFVATQMAAVYLANTGEARFIYSFLPALTILGILLWSHVSRRQRIGLLSLSAVVSLGLMFVKPLAQMMTERDKNRFMRMTTEEKVELVENRLKSIPVLKSEPLCRDNFKESQKCLAQNQTSCSPEQAKNIFFEFQESQKESMTEERLFCRNLFMVRLWNEKNLPMPIELVQKPSPLPEGPFSGSHPIEAIAGQLLHIDLLSRSGASNLIPAEESFDNLLHVLLKYQHRISGNRSEYQGAVVEKLNKADPSERAAGIYLSSLQQALIALKKTPTSTHPPSHQE